MKSSVTELLSPAGSFETALAAFAAGADAVYLGLDAFSARADAVNFTPAQLRDLLALARPEGRRVYVTFNTVIDQSQLPQAIEKLAILDELAPDGLIVQDLGVARIVRRNFPQLALHASTQLVAHNLEGVLAMKELGFTRVVLARELPLEDIRSLVARGGVEIEVFVHGALCYSISGLCLFSAMEKNRSGNRGACAYCCRLACTDASGNSARPFSMRDLRLDDSLYALRDAGVASLKIEGRMKSPLYVATVTSRYRQLLDGLPPSTTRADLETVFSRNTTHLYLDGYPPPAPSPSSADVIDPSNLGHLGTPIGTVKRFTKDREGRTWLRLHTSRALERHDGLQFLAQGGKPYGFGISEMRTSISRSTVFSVRAGSDVEILMPAPEASAPAPEIRPGDAVYCSASNEVKRRFPVPSFRPSACESGTPIELEVTLSESGVSASARTASSPVVCAEASISAPLAPSRQSERTRAAVEKAFARLGGTEWRLASLALNDQQHLFVPASTLNDLRRQLVEKLDAARIAVRTARMAAATDDAALLPSADGSNPPSRVLKMRIDQPIPDDACSFDEIVVSIGHQPGRAVDAALQQIAERLRTLAGDAGDPVPSLRLALPVFTRECDLNTLRSAVKHMAKAGISAWEAADLATLRILRQLGLEDITADWTLYAFNAAARAQLCELGVQRIVASPENNSENLLALASQPPSPPVEFLVRQSTPLFISLTRPATPDPSRLDGLSGDTFTCHAIDGLWVTTRMAPRRFSPPGNARTTRVDVSWDASMPAV